MSQAEITTAIEDAAAAMERELATAISALQTSLTTAIAAKQDKLKTITGTDVAAGTVVMSQAEIMKAIEDATSQMCGLRNVTNCAGEPVCDGAILATCRDLEDAISKIVPGGGYKDCDGTDIPSGGRIASCKNLQDAIAGVVVNLKDCSGASITSDTPIASCANLIAATTFAAAVAPATSENSSIPTTRFGGNNSFMGTPAGWITLKSAAGDVKVPYYV